MNTSTTMKLSTPRPGLTVLAAALLLAACSTRAPVAPDKAAANARAAERPSGERISDKRITLDHKAFAEQQAAIKALNDTGGQPLRAYSMAKAQCWLDVSFHEYTRNDRSAFPDAALEQSRHITRYLQDGGRAGDAANPAHATPLVNNAQRLRPDLWSAVAALKAQRGFACAQAQTACAEVELVHAGNEINQQGWRHAKPYVQIAEDQVGHAQRLAEACPGPVAALPAAELPPPPSPPPQPKAIVTTDKITLGASALFRFDKSSPADLLSEGLPPERRTRGHVQVLGGPLDRQTISQHLGLVEPLALVAQPGQGRAGQCVEGLTAGAALVPLQPVCHAIAHDAVLAAVWASSGLMASRLDQFNRLDCRGLRLQPVDDFLPLSPAQPVDQRP